MRDVPAVSLTWRDGLFAHWPVEVPRVRQLVPDELLLVNTVRGSRKEQNAEENVHVAVSMTDPDDPYRFLSVRGEVIELTEEGARVLVKIRPNSVTAWDESGE
jgi:hypothetical protein